MTAPADISALITDAVEAALGPRTATLDGQLPIGYAVLGYPREDSTDMTIWGPYADVEPAETAAQKRRDAPERHVQVVALYALRPDAT